MNKPTPTPLDVALEAAQAQIPTRPLPAAISGAVEAGLAAGLKALESALARAARFEEALAALLQRAQGEKERLALAKQLFLVEGWPEATWETASMAPTRARYLARVDRVLAELFSAPPASFTLESLPNSLRRR